MGKYDPLRDYLKGQRHERLNVRFSEIEKLGISLPASAKAHRPWWANNKHHSQANAWLDAGYETEQVDVGSQRLTFVNFASRGAYQIEHIEEEPSSNEEASLQERLDDMELKLSMVKSDLRARNREIDAQQAIIESQANRLSEKANKRDGGLVFAAFLAGALIFGLL